MSEQPKPAKDSIAFGPKGLMGIDQPKPATGSWDYVDFYDLDLEQAQEMAKRINAALAAERESMVAHARDEVWDEVKQLREQLAAERERYSTKSLVGFSREALIQAEREIAAEEQKSQRHLEAANRLTGENIELEAQLAAERERYVRVMASAMSALEKKLAAAREEREIISRSRDAWQHQAEVALQQLAKEKDGK